MFRSVGKYIAVQVEDVDNPRDGVLMQNVRRLGLRAGDTVALSPDVDTFVTVDSAVFAIIKDVDEIFGVVSPEALENRD